MVTLFSEHILKSPIILLYILKNIHETSTEHKIFYQKHTHSALNFNKSKVDLEQFQELANTKEILNLSPHRQYLYAHKGAIQKKRFLKQMESQIILKLNYDIFKIVYFASIFIKILVYGFLVKSLSSFGIRVILASQNVLETILLSSIFGRVCEGLVLILP